MSKPTAPTDAREDASTLYRLVILGPFREVQKYTVPLPRDVVVDLFTRVMMAVIPAVILEA